MLEQVSDLFKLIHKAEVGEALLLNEVTSNLPNNMSSMVPILGCQQRGHNMIKTSHHGQFQLQDRSQE